MAEVAQPLVSNGFGTVYSDRIGYYAGKSWFSAGALEELPMRHITSVRSEVSRNLVWGVIFILCGIAAFNAGIGGVIVGLILLAFAALFIWGSPSVRINTAGGESRPVRGWPWQRDMAESFTAAVRKALFDKE